MSERVENPSRVQRELSSAHSQKSWPIQQSTTEPPLFTLFSHLQHQCDLKMVDEHKRQSSKIQINYITLHEQQKGKIKYQTTCCGIFHIY